MKCFRNGAAGAIVGLVLGWGASSLTEAANLYRYRNDQGVLVIDHTVPAGAAQRGYEILGDGGKVIETVAPADANGATPDAQPAPAMSAAQHAAQEKVDRYLLTSYSSVADIEAVKARRVEEVAREIGIAETRIGELGRQRLALEEQAANLQRGGKPVPKELMAELASMDAQAATSRRQLAERQRQRTELEAHYDAYARRFIQLKAPTTAPPAAPEPAATTAPASAP